MLVRLKETVWNAASIRFYFRSIWLKTDDKSSYRPNSKTKEPSVLFSVSLYFSFFSIYFFLSFLPSLAPFFYTYSLLFLSPSFPLLPSSTLLLWRWTSVGKAFFSRDRVRRERTELRTNRVSSSQWRVKRVASSLRVEMRWRSAWSRFKKIGALFELTDAILSTHSLFFSRHYFSRFWPKRFLVWYCYVRDDRPLSYLEVSIIVRWK